MVRQDQAGDDRLPESPADGLFYCLIDETIYVYEAMLQEELVAGADWQTRDYVIATVVAHEWGHHIQMLTGLAPLSIVFTINQEQNAPLIARQRELQADCYAGLFTRYARDRGWLNAGDLEEAREAHAAGRRRAPGSPGPPRHAGAAAGVVHARLQPLRVPLLRALVRARRQESGGAGRHADKLPG